MGRNTVSLAWDVSWLLQNAARCRTCLCAFLWPLGLLSTSLAVAATNELPLPQHWDGSRVVPVHRIVLYDENGEDIAPGYARAMPFSARTTCGACHDYATISRGFHFNYMSSNAVAGRAGQPWIWVDERAGMQLPLAYRPWTNAWHPSSLGLTPWQMTLEFGRHMPGGGSGEATDAADPEARWQVSGPLEINCLGCHSASPRQDQSEWAKQVMRGNLRWAATAASGLGDVGGMASRMPDTWDVVQGPNKDDAVYAVAPNVRYDVSLFDLKNRALIDISSRPKDARCLYCHSVAQPDTPREALDADVHSRAGIMCADCHRAGLDHNISRGYETEAADRHDDRVRLNSCRGCHLGTEGARDMAAVGGRLGTRIPAHRGFPPIHFEKLSCTACHSGPWPGDRHTRVKTSRANRLGIYGVARWATDAPFIAEPVFVKGQDGRIAPHRMMWPSFWAVRSGDALIPLDAGVITQSVGHILEAGEAVARILVALRQGLAEGEPVFVSSGITFRVSADATVEPASCARMAAQDPAWAAMANDTVVPLVAPAASSTGSLDRATEDGIVSILSALAAVAGSNQPVACIGARVFAIDVDGFLAPLEGIAGQGGQDGEATWHWLLPDKTLAPLVPEFVVQAVTELAGTEFSFTEAQLARALQAMAALDPARQHVYVACGKVFELRNGALAVSDHPAAEPRAWPAAHNVRPAAQALGARQCTECHSYNAPFFFAGVEARGPLKTSHAGFSLMWQFEGIAPNFNRLFGLTFLIRSMYKTIMFSLAAVIALALLLIGLRILKRAGVFFVSPGPDPSE